MFLACCNIKFPASKEETDFKRPEDYKNFKRYFQRSSLPPAEHAYAYARKNDDGRPWLEAEFEGEVGCWQYTFDPYLSESESLHVLPRPDQDWRAPEGVVISSQPLGWSYRQPRLEPVILMDVGIDLLTHDNETVQLQVQETYLIQRKDTRALALNLRSYFEKWNRNAPDLKYLRLRSVVDGSGNALPFSHRNHNLLIELPEALQPGSILKLAFAIEGDFLVHPNGDNSWALGTTSWFPQPGWGGELYTVRCRMKVKQPFLPIASGENSVRRSEGDYNILETSFDKPICFFVALAGNYSMKEETKDGITLRVASYGSASSNTPRIMNMAWSGIQFYPTSCSSPTRPSTLNTAATGIGIPKT
jgi:hypothetical protein